MLPDPVPHAVVAVLEEMHAAVALEALDAAGIEAEAAPSRAFAQLDYFRAHRIPLVELRVAQGDLSRARGVLAVLADEVAPALRAEATDRQPPGAGASTGAAGSPPSFRRTRWVVAAALATVAIGSPLLTRGRAVGERLRRALTPGDTRHGHVTAPRMNEPVERELENAGLR